MFNYDSVTKPPRALFVAAAVIALVTVMLLALGARGSSAQEVEASSTGDLDAAPAAVDPADLVAALEQARLEIEVLEEQLAFARQTALDSEHRVDNQRATILAFQDADRFADEFQAQALEAWRIGYTIGGGRNLAAFENVILPCESGGEPDPDAAIGPTDDWGRAQINRPTWSGRFEALTDRPFEDWIRDPILNGYMAAVIEDEHPSGLNAWTCWRRR